MSEENQNQTEGTNETPVEETKVLFDLKRPIFTPLNDSDKKRADRWIGMPGYHQSSPYVDQASWKPFQDEDKPHMTEWGMAVDDAVYTGINGDYPYVEINKDPSKWSQFIKYQSFKLTVAPRDGALNKIQGQQNITGKTFLAAARKRHKESGAEVMFPLPHSGLWLAVKPAKDTRWLAFDTERGERRISIGRDTTGLMLSSRAGYEQQDILDFILEHVTYCNVKDYDSDTILNKISFLDLPFIIWGFCVANQVAGHPIRIPCLTDPAKCTNTVEVMLQLKAMAWYNNDKFTEKQLKHITEYRKDYTAEEVNAYLNDGIFSKKRTITMEDGTVVTLRIPTATHALYCSRRWCESVISEIDAALSRTGRKDSVPENNRYIHLMRGLEESHLREYSAWIERIDIPVGDNEDELGAGNFGWSTSIDDIENWLEEMSDDRDIAKKLYEEIKQYMSDMTLGVIGHPTYVCPACGGGHNIDDPEFAQQGIDCIVPIDLVKYFLVSMARQLEQTKAAYPINPMGR